LNQDFWNEFETYILETYEDPLLKDLINFNKNMLLTLDYNHRKGKEILCTHDWFEYLEYCTWNCADNTEEDFNIEETLIPKPKEFDSPKVWLTKDCKLGAFPMGPNQDTTWSNKEGEEKITMFVNSILAPTYMRGTRTVFNRGSYV
jgi:hypothetical protein